MFLEMNSSAMASDGADHISLNGCHMDHIANYNNIGQGYSILSRYKSAQWRGRGRHPIQLHPLLANNQIRQHIFSWGLNIVRALITSKIPVFELYPICFLWLVEPLASHPMRRHHRDIILRVQNSAITFPPNFMWTQWFYFQQCQKSKGAKGPSVK